MIYKYVLKFYEISNLENEIQNKIISLHKTVWLEVNI